MGEDEQCAVIVVVDESHEQRTTKAMKWMSAFSVLPADRGDAVQDTFSP